MIKTVPYDFQKIAILNSIEIIKKEKILALFCSMGTGKTLMSLCISNQLYNDHIIDTVLVVCPKTLMSTWMDEIDTHFSKKPPVILWDSQKVKTKKYQNEVNRVCKLGFKIFIINIEAFSNQNLLLKKSMLYLSKDTTFAVVDESSKIKTYNSNRTKNLTKQLRSCGYHAILTGTEITNTIMDLYSQFEFMRSKFWNLKNWYAFRAYFGILEDQYAPGGRTFKVVTGFRRVDELQKNISPFVIRLKKEDCLDLPEKIFQTIKLKMPMPLRVVYESLKKKLYAEYKNEELTVANKISLFTRFRQLTGGFFPVIEQEETVKFEYFEENEKLFYLLNEAEDSNEKIIFWAYFREEIRLLAEKIGKIGNFVEFHGGISQKQRDENKQKFKDDPSCRFLIINPQTGAFGLNLQFCHNAFYYSLPTSPEEYWQSLDRIHRNGQKEKVLYKKVLYENSVDERLEQLLVVKTNLREKFASMSVTEIFDFI